MPAGGAELAVFVFAATALDKEFAFAVFDKNKNNYNIEAFRDGIALFDGVAGEVSVFVVEIAVFYHKGIIT